MIIGKNKISKDSRVFIIAEVGINHGGSFKECIKFVNKAKESGADAVKLQTYKADTITLKSNKKDFRISKYSPWKKYKNFWNLYRKASTPWSWHKELFRVARKNKIEIIGLRAGEKIHEDLISKAGKRN